MILGVDGWSVHDGDADLLAHLVRGVVGDRLGLDAARSAVVATHEVRGPRGHSSVSCTVPEPASDGPAGLGVVVRDLVGALATQLPADGAVAATSSGLVDGIWHGTDPDALAGAWQAVAAAATATSGRLVHFPGAERLTGRLTVDDVLAASAVDEVVVVGGSPHRGTTVLDTRGFVRPRLEAGRVRLLVQPAAGGSLVPFDRADAHRCCEDH